MSYAGPFAKKKNSHYVTAVRVTDIIAHKIVLDSCTYTVSDQNTLSVTTNSSFRCLP
jgi:hypothetical protein